jgi:hypothetical protein
MSDEALVHLNGSVNAQNTPNIPTQNMKSNFMTKMWLSGVPLMAVEKWGPFFTTRRTRSLA